MTEQAIAAIYRAIQTTLSDAGRKAFLDIAPQNAQFAYELYSLVGGGAWNEICATAANIVVQIKSVSDVLSEALAGAAIVSQVFDDAGYYDHACAGKSAVSAGDEWVIKTITQEDVISVTEMINGVTPVYHQGSEYRFIMEVV